MDKNKSIEVVKHPSHYTQFTQEAIVTIDEWVSGYKEGYMGYYIGTILKYLARAPYKHSEPYEDLKKAYEYFTHLMNHINKNEGDKNV